jgi:hypothetical protein
LVCIAANAATFALVNSVLLRPLPVPDAGAILLMANRYPKAGADSGYNSAPGDYYDRLRDIHVFSEQACSAPPTARSTSKERRSA